VRDEISGSIDEQASRRITQLGGDSRRRFVKVVEAAEARNHTTGEFIKVQDEGMAIWTDPKDKSECYFYYHAGEISVKSPNDKITTKMKAVAQKLKARVIGDEGEEYR